MNRVTFSQTVDGYSLYAHSRQLSEHTITDYRNTFRRFQRFLALKDSPIAEVTLDVVESSFSSLSRLSKKRVRDYHTGLSALWTWALKRGLVDEHAIRRFDAPKPDKTTIEIFVEEEVQKLLLMCGKTKSY